MRRLDREDQRLLDAYQGEIIDLEELNCRRQQISARRQNLTSQHEQQTRLRAERQAAQEVWAELKAFCERVNSRLEDASMAEKQRLLQLLIDRVIVGEETLEIRHVIPLRRLQPEALDSALPDSPREGQRSVGSPPKETIERLRSDGVRPAKRQQDSTFLDLFPCLVRRITIDAENPFLDRFQMVLGHVVRATTIQHKDHGFLGVEDPRHPALADLAFHAWKDQPACLIGMPVLLLLVVFDQSLVDGREQRRQPLQASGQGSQR